MPIRCALAALLLGCVSLPAVAAQDERISAAEAAKLNAETWVVRNLQARGGAAALAAIKNVTFEGRLIFPGDFELKYKETRERLGQADASRTDLTLQGLDVIQAYDGQSAWRVNPFQGRKDPERMASDETRSLADASLVEGPLLASRSDGSRVNYLGREDFDGTLAYKLKVSQKDGDEFVYWLDPDTFLEIKIDETRRIRGAQQTTETELGDYEKVAGVYFPMSVESWTQGQSNQRQRTIVATSTANTAVDAAFFAEPHGPATPVTAAGEPPDAPKKPGENKPAEPTTPPSTPPKGK